MILPRTNAASVAPVANLVGLSHRYGKTVALEHVDLAVPSGCMVGFFGPDGVGKSTLLAVIAGVRKIQTGTVEVLGGDMARCRSSPRRLPSNRLHAPRAGAEFVCDALGL